jgi:hypothetical protein
VAFLRTAVLPFVGAGAAAGSAAGLRTTGVRGLRTGLRVSFMCVSSMCVSSTSREAEVRREYLATIAWNYDIHV